MHCGNEKMSCAWDKGSGGRKGLSVEFYQRTASCRVTQFYSGFVSTVFIWWQASCFGKNLPRGVWFSGIRALVLELQTSHSHPWGRNDPCSVQKKYNECAKYSKTRTVSFLFENLKLSDTFENAYINFCLSFYASKSDTVISHFFPLVLLR